MLHEGGFDVSAHAATPAELLTQVAVHRPDVVVVDLVTAGTAAALHIAGVVRDRWPATAVLVLSDTVLPERARDLLRSGGHGVGYLLRSGVGDTADLLEAAHRVAAGGTALDPAVLQALATARPDRLARLTARELDVLRLIAEGRSNGAIARRLGVGKRAVEKHVGSVFTKLGLPADCSHDRRVLAVLASLDRAAVRPVVRRR